MYERNECIIVFFFLQKLHSEIEMLRHRANVSSQTKDNLLEQVKVYQEEINELKNKIKVYDYDKFFFFKKEKVKKSHKLQNSCLPN